MEPQEINYCCINNKNDKNKGCKCIAINLIILIALFVGVIGLILGAVFSAALLANIAVLILGAVIVGLLTILTIIYKICICNKKKGC